MCYLLSRILLFTCYRYWLGSLKMLHHLQRKHKGLEIVVRLRDITLLAADGLCENYDKLLIF